MLTATETVKHAVTIYKIPCGAWTEALCDAIEKASDGNTISCHSEAMVELGRLAASRMVPDKALIFTVDLDSSP